MLIAFVAPKQFGKSTACNILKEYWGENVTQVNFKDALIEELKQNFPDLLRYYQHLYGKYEVDELFRDKPEPIRLLMQNYGTEVRRGDRDSYWVDKWLNAVHTEERNVLVDDCRFINEAKAVKLSGGILIRLNRTDKESTDIHQSETEQREIVCDYEITVGEGELDLLKTKLLDIVKDVV